MADSQNKPRTSKLKATPDVTWDNGDNFNGFGIVVIVPPTVDAISWPSITIDPNSPSQRLPQTATIPIVDGVFNNSVGIFYNEDLDPPNSKYCIFYFDSGWNQVGVPASASDFFVVNSAETNPPQYTLETPVAGTQIPTLRTT